MSDFNPKNLNKFQKFFFDYASYHHNTVNILIHIVCVPVIYFSLMFITRYLSKEYLNCDFNLGLILMIAATPLYIYTEFWLGMFTAIQYFVLDYASIGYQFNCEKFPDIQIMVGIHVLAWVLQFIGHGAFEGRKPALMDNLLLTLNAPFFVNLEIFNFFFGYKKREIDEAMKYVEHAIKLYKEGKNKKN